MDRRRLDRRINPWRFYFVNRRVANLAGFLVVLLAALLLASAYFGSRLQEDYATTVYAFAAIIASYVYVSRVLARQKSRNYLAKAGR